MKTHYKKMQNPNFLGSWDLTDPSGKYIDITPTIIGIKKDWVFDGNGGKEELPVLELKGYKPMVLNSTNLKAIAKVTGSKFVEDWAGKKIIIRVAQVKAFGEVHDALRIATTAPKVSEMDLANQKIKALLETYKGEDKEDIRKMCQDKAKAKEYTLEFAKNVIIQLGGSNE